MLLLVTGASGAGKSTVRELVAGQLKPDVECLELAHLLTVPAVPTIAWRQRATEAAVQRAVALQADDRHLLLAGDPVAAGEVIAAPSATKLSAIAVCLLDINADAQAARLKGRGDDPRWLTDHRAFADWMRAHAHDPRHATHVLSSNGWDHMRWERLDTFAANRGEWHTEVIDTSARSRRQVADEILTWCQRVLAGQTRAIRVVDNRSSTDTPAAEARLTS
jgi:broad-specificity NMP kinase